MKNEKIAFPKPGRQKEIARQAGCGTETVRPAIRRRARGIKAETVRRLHGAKYPSDPNPDPTTRTPTLP